ncbi:MAG: nucleotide exchange factor GrpE [Candidatus Neomarinimicrobiota bacterium]
MPTKKKSPNGEIAADKLKDVAAEGATEVAAQPETYSKAPSKGKSIAESASAGKEKEAPKHEPADSQDEEGIIEKYLRLRAEFDNYIKRTNREKSELLEYGGDGIVRRILPIIDDLRRTVEHARLNGTPENNSILEGIVMIQEKLIKTLEALGVREIEAVGKPFDPEFHEALMTREAEDTVSGTVLEEFEPGFMYRDRVIRHSKVIVSS